MSKTIETHLQSNEVRIPKKSSGAGFDVSSTAAPCQYFKSSFARSLSFSQGGHHGGGAGDNHFTRSLDFEVNYGGGLSTIPDGTAGGGSSQTTPSASPVFDPDRELLNGEKTKLANGISTANGGVVKTLWNYAKGSPSKSASPGGTPSKLASGAAVAAAAASTTAASASQATAAMSGSGSSSSSARKSVEANEIEVLRLRKECQNLIEENRRLVNLAANSGYAINGLMNGNSGHGGGPHHQHHHGGHGHGHHGGASSGSGSSSLTTSLGLGLAGGGGVGGAGAGPVTATVAGMYSTVESVILQTQVETLQWQLKQVDSSRQMYRAVMEEVVRYLDRCYRSLDAIGHTSNIGRSKSVLQVSRVPSSSSTHNHDSDSSNASSPRARSSTNLIDVQKSSLSMSSSSSSYTKKQHQLQQQQQQQQHQSQSGSTSLTNGNHNSLLLDDDSVVVSASPAGSYSTFRDFTWRRSPKRTANQPATLPISGAEVDPEKLAQEAFRLLRTVQNLLNTQEPTLSSQSSSASSGLDSLLLLAAGSGNGGGGGSATGSTTTLTAGVAPVVNTRSNVGFSRKLNMRGSRLSLRSSTDDSVHSTSSSNNEDNTDRPSPPLLNHHGHHHPGGSSSSSSTSSSSGSHLVNHRHSANIDRIKEMMIASSAEDESGFSSMNSFQEIGLPLVNSTMLSSANGTDSNSSAASSTGSVSFVSDESSDIRDATVIPKLGIPTSKPAPEIPTRVTQSAAYEHHNHFVNHRRWDSAPVMLPQKLKIHQHVGGAGNGGDSDSGVSSRVLWV